MKNRTRIILGLLITALVFLIPKPLGNILQLNSDFFPYTFVTHTIMIAISFGLIFGLKKYVNYRIAWPKFRKMLKPIFLALLATVVVNISIGMLTMALGWTQGEVHYAFTQMSVQQIFLFVFIYASVAEEILFRGFLQNFLSPLQPKGIKLFGRHISAPVLISAVIFGLAHLTLIATGASVLFLVRVVVFTTVLGIIAGYYQEKYDNNAYAIVVHMAGNFLGLIGAMMMDVSERMMQ